MADARTTETRAWLPRHPPAWLAFAALATAGLVARGLLAYVNPWPSVDGAGYIMQARELVRSGQLPYSSFPPGWPLIVALPLRVMGLGDPYAPLRAAQGANVLLGALLPWLTYRLVRRDLGRGWSLAIAALLTFLPQNLILAKGDLSEPSYGCAVLGAALLLAGRRRLAAGLVLGYAYLIRPEALILAAALTAALFRRERRPPWTFWAGVALVATPYVLFIHARTGLWGLSGKSVFLARAWAAHPGWGMIGLYGRNAAAFLAMLAGLVGLPVCLLAAVAAVRGPRTWLPWLTPLALLPLFDFVMAPRYWAPYLPFVLWGAAHGARSLLALARGRRPRAGHPTAVRAAAPLLAGLTLAGLGLAARADARGVLPRTETYFGLRDGGIWLRGRVERSTLVADYKPFLPYWADCRHLACPAGPTAEAIVAAARAAGADFLIVNVAEVRHHVPALDPLLAIPPPPSLANALTVVNVLTYADDPQQNTIIYRIDRP
ncbi:MAG: hypothetical protein ACYDIE_05150 [Candidatus Krumholzibacteriia bacterium]